MPQKAARKSWDLSAAANGWIQRNGFSRPIFFRIRYALDLWAEGIEMLIAEVKKREVNTIHANVADISRRMPLETSTMDICLMATVLHDLIEDHTDQGTLQEVARVMKPGGKLAVIEFKKMDGPPGPPQSIRLSPQETEACLVPHAFEALATFDIGAYNYLSTFRYKS